MMGLYWWVSPPYEYDHYCYGSTGTGRERSDVGNITNITADNGPHHLLERGRMWCLGAVSG